MNKKEITKIMKDAGFQLKDSSYTNNIFEKIYSCGARASYFFNSKDKGILINWNVNPSSNFTFSKDFPMVNKIHYHKATTYHSFDSLKESFEQLENNFNIK